MRTQIPLLLGFLGGTFMFVQYFVPHQAGVVGYEMLLEWLRIIGAFAMILGVASLFRSNWDKIRRRQHDYGYAIVTLVCFVVMVYVGIIHPSGEQTVWQRLWDPEDGPAFQWLFSNVMVPLDATMFSLLAFFIASAAYRTFRARTPEATILLVSAIIVMLGRVPIGELISTRMPDVYEWFMMVPTVAGKRGILFGVALGSIATSLRIILGIERSHLGGGK